jgi:DNA helicase-2/ATP-dependent DNA helicase PcrA
MPSVITIDSGRPVDDIERHLRVVAGPGAGKTHWLIVQISHVIRSSPRLPEPSRVGCISYTNAAVTEILRRLGDAADRAEVATIHSFLYRNVVRPYLHLLRDAAGKPLVAFELVDGHDDPRPTYGSVREGLTRAGYVGQIPQEAVEFARSLRWQRDGASGSWSLKPKDAYRRPSGFFAKQEHVDAIKQPLWDRGIIDHDDLLYFAYLILERNPLVTAHLADRFPYLFVDEFQDTVPIQTQIVRWLAEQGTKVTVIGDREQSIYEFAGASPEDFDGFSLPDQFDLQLLGNRRSTKRITSLLNALRSDGLEQQPVREDRGEEVVFLVGAHPAALGMARAMADDGRQEVIVLARNNDLVAATRSPDAAGAKSAWSEFYESDAARAVFFERLVRGVEMARLGDPASGLREALKSIRIRSASGPLKCPTALGDWDRKSVAVGIVEFLVSHRDELGAMSLSDVYAATRERLGLLHNGLTLTGVSAGKFQEFARRTMFSSLVATVDMPDDGRQVRTIHRAKGQEFDNVYVRLEDGKKGPKAEKLIASMMEQEPSSEETRLVYVACSRPRERLFVSLPSLAPELELRLRSINVRIHRCK